MIRLGLALSLVAALAGCTSSKQITLTIDTTAGVPCDIDSVRVTATADQITKFTHTLTAQDLPLTIALSDDTEAAGFQLDVTGLKGGQDVLRKSGMLAFGAADQIARVVLEPQCTVDRMQLNPSTGMQEPAICDLPALAPIHGPAPAVLPRYGCGGVSRYTMQPGDAVFFDACAHVGAGAGQIAFPDPEAIDSGAVEISALHDALANAKFRFYGQPIRRIWVDRRGYLSFTDGNPDPTDLRPPASFDSGIIKGFGPPSQSAMVFWDDLSASGACYALDGEPGIQTLRLTWHDACEMGDNCMQQALNFTIVLYEHTQRIDFSYGAMQATHPELARGAAATVGIVNQATGCVVSECDAGSGLCKDGVTPCGYSQVFSATEQPNGVADVGFEPVFE